MCEKIYVANLSPNINNGDLERLFTPYGRVVRAEVLTDPLSGRSTEAGWVQMSSDREGHAAIASLDGREHCNRVLMVDWAKHRQKPINSRSSSMLDEPEIAGDATSST
jgi:RNA recognition motif-containing protein